MNPPTQPLPELSSVAIRDTVEAILKLNAAERVFAFYGTGRRDAISLKSGESLTITPVRSEIDLRAQLPDLDKSRELTAYLVPWQREVPLDLVGRFAKRGRILSIGHADRLRALLGGVEVDSSLQTHPLPKYLLRSDNPHQAYRASGGYVNEDSLWALWLRQDFGLEADGAIARDNLLAWAAGSERGALFLEAMQHPAAGGLRKALLEHLERSLGPIGSLIWRQWEAGRALELLAFGVLCEAVQGEYAAERSEGAAVRIWMNQNLKSRFAVPVDQAPQRVKELADATGMALRLITSNRRDPAGSPPKLAESAVAQAERMVDSDIRSAMSQSRRLPTAWQLRLDELGAALKQGALTPTKEAVQLADERRRSLELHDFFKHSRDDQKIHRAEMAVRLLAWLSSHPLPDPSGIGTPYADAETLAQWYTTEGGYLDWARRAARGSTEDALGQGIAAVLAQVDTLRTEMDQSFARALAEWHQASRPEHRLLPIDRALARIAVPFLKEQDHPEAEPRKLLVLLMDGMAWAQAVQLLRSMQELHPHPWAPLVWHAHAANRIGSSAYPPVLANLPTVTEVSRSAFFAGKPLPSGSKLQSQQDPERFAQNKLLQPFCEGASAPRLMLRGESHKTDGSASEAALSLIEDGQRRIVAVVINAIDASLKGDSQQETQWEVSTIKSLGAFLEAARKAGRQVLFASDHGHVPSDRLESLASPAQAGARHRPWSGPEDPVQASERVFSGEGVYAEKEMKGAVLLTTDTKRYGGAASAGEHGGATLAEVVTPCLLLGWDEPGIEIDHPNLRISPLFVPDWWHFMAPAAAQPAKPPSSRGSSKRPPSTSQLSLLKLLPAEPVAAPPAASAASAAAAADQHPAFNLLVNSEMLRARQPKKPEREQTARTVVFLLERGGTVSAELFAKQRDLHLFRVEGAVSNLTEILNVDGYEVLRFDRQNRQVVLDKAKLEQQFEVKL